eukprot:11335953-Alexandrium_andersonii.AAC.1
MRCVTRVKRGPEAIGTKVQVQSRGRGVHTTFPVDGNALRAYTVLSVRAGRSGRAAPHCAERLLEVTAVWWWARPTLPQVLA